MAKRVNPDRQGTPSSYIASGVILLVLAAVVGGAVGFDTAGGIAIAAAIGLAGQITLMIGVIARGVQLGNEASRGDGNPPNSP